MSLLNPLMQEDSIDLISGWGHQGQLLWDYIEVTNEIKSLLQTADCTEIGYKLELLQPQLTCLCSKINLFPCPTAKHRYFKIFLHFDLNFLNLNSHI